MFNGYLELKNFNPEDLKIKPNQHFIAIIKLLPKNHPDQQLDYVRFDKISKDWSKHLKNHRIKKNLPINPHKIGLIICDDSIKAKKFHKNLQKELPLTQIMTFPVSTTKPDSVTTIANTIKKINQANSVDLLIVLKDKDELANLWLLNQREIIEKTSKTQIPLITFISRLKDYTLLDEIADFSAANYKEIMDAIVYKETF